MADTTPKHIVRRAKNLEEATSLWWPLMVELGWVRPSYLFSTDSTTILI
jgi:hypothetical protein